MASFSTVSLMREAPEVVARFVAYYRRAGATEALVFHDGPAGDLAGLEVPGLVLVVCDEAFWEAQGGRPAAVEDRQAAVYRLGLERCRSDWMLVVDADEFVFGDCAIPAFLDMVPGTVDAVSVPTAEAVWGPGDDLDAPFGSTHFRTVWRRDRLWRPLRRVLYAGVWRYMRRGLIGHASGKQFLRASGHYSVVGNHGAKREGRVITRPAAEVNPALGGMYVGHFDAIGLARWAQKWRQRIERETIAVNMEGERRSQQDLVADAIRSGEAETRALFRGFYGLSRAQYATLAFFGYAFRRDIFVSESRAEPAADRLCTSPTIS